jgi:hypothetical protein
MRCSWASKPRRAAFKTSALNSDFPGISAQAYHPVLTEHNGQQRVLRLGNRAGCTRVAGIKRNRGPWRVWRGSAGELLPRYLPPASGSTSKPGTRLGAYSGAVLPKVTYFAANPNLGAPVLRRIAAEIDCSRFTLPAAESCAARFGLPQSSHHSTSLSYTPQRSQRV